MDQSLKNGRKGRIRIRISVDVETPLLYKPSVDVSGRWKATTDQSQSNDAIVVSERCFSTCTESSPITDCIAGNLSAFERHSAS